MTAEYATLETLTRDPLRIPHTLSALAGFWAHNGDMTLGEIIESVGVALERDPYNIEEQTFIEYFKIAKSNTAKSDENPDILKVLASLEPYWMRYPDLRLGQIIGNVKSQVGKRDYADVTNEDIVNTVSVGGAWI